MVREHPEQTVTRTSALALTRQIFTLSTFRARTRKGEGVFVISGQSAPVMHACGCRWVTDEHFASKVIHSEGRGGRYWWFPSATEARTCLGEVRLCSRCITSDVTQQPARRRAPEVR